MQIHPTKNYILCTIHEGRNIGKLHVPQGSAELQPYALIVLCGPDCVERTIGEMVVFSPGNVMYTEEKAGEKYVLVPETCVFALYTPEDSDAHSTN